MSESCAASRGRSEVGTLATRQRLRLQMVQQESSLLNLHLRFMPRWGTRKMAKLSLSFEMNRRISVFAMLLFGIAILLTGCPDRSYQRPVPDYENMVDGAAASSVEE